MTAAGTVRRRRGVRCPHGRPPTGDRRRQCAPRPSATSPSTRSARPERIARLSRIREFVLGAQDGLLVPLGVVTGMAAAHPARSLIIVAGLAEAVAGAISMGGGSYLASEAEEQLYASEIAAEGQEIADFPERETAELALDPRARGPCPRAGRARRARARLEPERLPAHEGPEGARALARRRRRRPRRRARRRVTYLGAAIVPLWPYFFFPLHAGARVSLACTLLALFLVGVAKGRVTRLSLAARRPPGGDHRLGQRRRRLRDRPRRHDDRRLA